jgi:hypothetical protein
LASPTYARLHNAAVAVANGAELPVTGLETVAFQITGTFVGTVDFEASVDGTIFVPLPATPSDDDPDVTSATTAGVWRANCAAISAWTSGTITVDAIATEGSLRSAGSGGGGGSSATEYEVDSASGANEKTVLMGMIRKDTPTALADADGKHTVPQATAEGSMRVSPDQIISQTATHANVAASTSSVQLLAANNARIGGAIVNDSDRTMRIKYAATASATSYDHILAPKDANGIGGQHTIENGHVGRVDGIWDSGVTGNARTLEQT